MEATTSAQPEAEPAKQEAMPAHPSAMQPRFGWLWEVVARRVFAHVVMNDVAVRKIRDLSQFGAVIYTLRQRSFVDYFLVNYVLRREGLPLPVFANGISSVMTAPLRSILANLRAELRARLSRKQGPAGLEDHDYCAQAVAAGKPVLIFMRGRRRRSLLRRWLGRSSASTRVGGDYLREIVHGHGEAGNEHYIIPMALFRGHSFRKRASSIAALVYSVQEVPSDGRKFLAYWWNRKDLFITVGKEVVLGEFVARYGDDGEEKVVRRLTRAIQIFLHREERVVLGPALLPRRRIKSLVLESDEIEQEIQRLAEQNNVSEAKLRKEAASYFDEMAADFNGILFAGIASIFKKIWARMFSGLVAIGFEEVVEKIRHNPVVLVPCHRSHFDYLIITYLCHLNFVSPPHIAAGINMAFWPMAPILRGSGAYFIRRQFADNALYKVVFHQYLSFLIREGYTQEFFIEGGRSRTGKMMTPRLGMLSAIVNAQLGGIRRDVYLVPVSIHYGRIVEEAAYQFELSGGEKEDESIGALLRARRFLKQRYGTVYLSFAKPISLNDELGERKQEFTEGEGIPEVEEEKRRFIQRLGFKILREVDECAVAGATSISATVLLGAPHGGRRYQDYAAQANALANFVIARGVQVTQSLERNIGDFRESLEFLSRSGLIESLERGDDEVLMVPDNKRLSLDFYKNSLIHVFLIPSLAVMAAASGKRDAEMIDEIWWWLDMFRYEFARPGRDQLDERVDSALSMLRDVGAIGEKGLVPSHPLVRAMLPILENFREGYWIAGRAIESSLRAADGVNEKRIIEVFQAAYKSGLLVGEVTKAEGSVVVLMRNALSRFSELGLVSIEAGGRGGRDRVVHPGPEYPQLRDTIEQLRVGVIAGQEAVHAAELASRGEAVLAVPANQPSSGLI